MSIYEQFQEMLSKGRLPIMEFELSTGDFLVVEVAVHTEFIEFYGDFQDLPNYFDGIVKSQQRNWFHIDNEDMDGWSLDQLLEFIHDNIMEGFLIPNNLLPEDSQ